MAATHIAELPKVGELSRPKAYANLGQTLPYEPVRVSEVSSREESTLFFASEKWNGTNRLPTINSQLASIELEAIRV
ncbi:MAG: hypothetical protein KDA88_02520 [Planctomycetaceae bacterium]|nr:hypothetical protein [Planctomycetaceae bacterium]